MPNNYFKFKQFTVYQDKTAMKVGVDSVLLAAWTNVNNVNSILDIGTGTGLLSLMLAQKTDAKITAIEIDKDAYSQAIENINISKWKTQIQVVLTSFQNFHDNNSKFDLIICNPPYFINSLKSLQKQRNTARHNDDLSLNDLFKGVKKILSEKGRMTLIYPYEQKELLFEVANNYKLYPSKALIIRGNENKKPNRIIIEFLHQKTEIKTEKINIRNSATNSYSGKYKEITKDYYL